SKRDWSSDVCSSDLGNFYKPGTVEVMTCAVLVLGGLRSGGHMITLTGFYDFQCLGLEVRVFCIDPMYSWIGFEPGFLATSKPSGRYYRRINCRLLGRSARKITHHLPISYCT